MARKTRAIYTHQWWMEALSKTEDRKEAEVLLTKALAHTPGTAKRRQLQELVRKKFTQIKLHHDQYGTGQVLRQEPLSEERTKYVVKFPDNVTRTFIYPSPMIKIEDLSPVETVHAEAC